MLENSKEKKTVSAKFRSHYGLSMSELAKLCGKSREAVMQWEYRHNCPAPIKYILKKILDENLTPSQMVERLKEVFDN